ncbi:hypothetical protein [Streptomyces sp. NPDC051016]|uniref:hypothetical protein n=1 Tax=Streptomyces sp. NPDC051016 TaxID=3365638 RepID=UPI00378ABF24
MAYLKASKHARMQTRALESLTDIADEQRNQMRVEFAALQDAKTSAARQNAAQALEATVAHLEALVERARREHGVAVNAAALADDLRERLPHRRAAAWARHGFQRQLVGGLAALAVVLAGERGARLRDTWAADLAGAPEEGLTLTRWQQVWHASGFVIAAIRMRGSTLTAPLWKPTDWLLASDSRIRTTTTLAVGAQVIYIARKDGLHGLITEGWGWCGACAVTLTIFFRWLRKVRGIELAVPDSSSNEQ